MNNDTEALRQELLDEACAGAFSGLGAMILDVDEIRTKSICVSSVQDICRCRTPSRETLCKELRDSRPVRRTQPFFAVQSAKVL